MYGTLEDKTDISCSDLADIMHSKLLELRKEL